MDLILKGDSFDINNISIKEGKNAKKLIYKVETNLSEQELIRLLSNATSTNKEPIIDQIPLSPRAGKSVFRQIDKGAKRPLW